VAWKILRWVEQELLELLEKALNVAAEEVVDGPRTSSSFVGQLPLREMGFEHCPAIPYWADSYGDPDLKHVLATLSKLNIRGQEGLGTAYRGLSTIYTIDGQTHDAYEFLYDEPRPGSDNDPPKETTPPTRLTLDDPREFTLSWTTYKNVYEDSQDLVEAFAGTLTDHDVATRSFWPTIASFGLPYNLLVLAKVNAKRAAELEQELGDAWAAEDMGSLHADGRLYEIDMRILASLEPYLALDGAIRFTPGTVTVLKQDPRSKELTPIAITVSTTDERRPRVYTVHDQAWLYALQAAKTSVTVWGIWLGHVYHWHIVTAAMQMTMYNHLPSDHRLYSLLQPQSQSLIDFDFVLLTHLWGQIAPPTPVKGYMPLLKLFDTFAKDRTFFDDDPQSELSRRGLVAEDFTVVTPWDAYPVVGFLLDIWEITGDFVTAVVHDMYTSDAEVAQDDGLEAWLTASRDPSQGNVRGLPEIQTRDELAKLLTSILYRVTVHGAGSLNPSVNPGLSFVANFPPCLQGTRIPEPGDEVSTQELLDLLPHTGTIGGMTTFYFTFVYSKPYERLIPSGKIESDPYFPQDQEPCNEALFAYRTAIAAFVDEYAVAWNNALERFRGDAASSVPSYAKDQYGLWPRSIEI
jgi:hypothetical protein